MYHYMGSMTTPGCDELVMWLVMDTPMHIRDRGLVSDANLETKRKAHETKRDIFQMEALRRNVDIEGNPLQDNYRPTQELNNREVHYYEGTCNKLNFLFFH